MDGSAEPRRWSGTQLDTAEHGVVKLLNAGLDDSAEEIIAVGWLDLESMGLLRVDDYQREHLKYRHKKSGLQKAIENGVALPAIILGMRGQRIQFPKGSSVCELRDNVYIIDGLQRVCAMMAYADEHPDLVKNLRIAAEVRFNTTKDTERRLFIDMNTQRVAVSPNVILRNERDDHPAILTLYGLSFTNKDFALYQRVSWNQRMARQEILTATVLARAMYALHRFAMSAGKVRVGISKHGHSGTAGGSHVAKTMIGGLDELAKNVGLQTYRSNVVDFFDIVDVCWGIRHVEYTQLASHLKGNFLQVLARLFSEHSNFWDSSGKRLKLDTDQRRKLAAFPILDPEVARLCGAGNAVHGLLYSMLCEHMNKGMRRNRLIKRRDASA